MTFAYIAYLILIAFICYLERSNIKRNMLSFYDLTSYKSTSLVYAIIVADTTLLVVCATLLHNVPYSSIITSFVCNASNVIFTYISIGNKFKHVLTKIHPIKGLVMLFICFSTTTVIMGLLPFHDPQHLANVHISKEQTITEIIGFVFTGIGEESMKLTFIVGFLSLSPVFTKNRRSIPFVIASCILSSAAFGLMHMLAWGNIAALDIAISSIITVSMIVLFKNIWIPMIAHFLYDSSESIAQYLNSPVQYHTMQVFMILTLLYFIYWYLNRGRNISQITQSNLTNHS